MKRIWVAVCAMVLMITLCVIELSFTNSSIDRLTEKLDQAEQKVHDQDYSTALRFCPFIPLTISSSRSTFPSPSFCSIYSKETTTTFSRKNTKPPPSWKT